MAEWIKYTQSLYTHHKVVAMATWLAKQQKFTDWLIDGAVIGNDSNVTRNGAVLLRPHVTVSIVVLHLLEFWCLSNSRGRVDGDDLVLNYVGVSDCDTIGGMPLLGEAMQRVGFVIEEPVGQNQTQLRLPNYLEHNTPASDAARLSNAQRQRRFRERKRADVNEAFGIKTGNSTSNDVTAKVTDTRNVTITLRNEAEESRIEENKYNPPTPLNSNSNTNIPDDSEVWETVEPPPKKKRGRNTAKQSLDGFDRFWEVYPKHQSRGPAEKSWKKLNPDESLVSRIIEEVIAQKQTDMWTKDDGQFVPLPSTWLNQKRWQDEIAVKIEKQPEKPMQNILSYFDIAHGDYSGATGFVRNTHLCKDLDCESCKPKR